MTAARIIPFPMRGCANPGAVKNAPDVLRDRIARMEALDTLLGRDVRRFGMERASALGRVAMAEFVASFVALERALVTRGHAMRMADEPGEHEAWDAIVADVRAASLAKFDAMLSHGDLDPTRLS